MAKKPMSIQEKLAAARAGGPAKLEEEETTAPAPAEEAVEAPEEAAATAPTPPPAAPAPSPGRPLSLKEKLAAARAGGAATPTAPAPKPAPAAPEPIEAAPAAEAPATPPPPPIPTGRPLSMKEKLAAARAGAAAAPAAGGAKPAAAKPAAAAAAAPAASKRELPPLEKITDPKDLAEAARRAGAEQAAKAKQAEAATAAPTKAAKKPEAKVVPPKPPREAAATAAAAPATEAATAQATRRGFLFGVSISTMVIAAWVAFTGAVTAFTVMLGRFMFPNVLAEPPSTIKIGLPTDFEHNEVNERWKAEWGFWIVRSNAYTGEEIIYALQSVCTHLGCPPNWLAGEQKFKCPCHGSGFYISGVNFEGPAPRPLERFKVAVADDGQIVVDKSQKFQEELGQWSDPDSFIPVA